MNFPSTCHTRTEFISQLLFPAELNSIGGEIKGNMTWPELVITSSEEGSTPESFSFAPPLRPSRHFRHFIPLTYKKKPSFIVYRSFFGGGGAFLPPIFFFLIFCSLRRILMVFNKLEAWNFRLLFCFFPSKYSQLFFFCFSWIKTQRKCVFGYIICKKKKKLCSQKDNTWSEQNL